jgi:hypothetical protein
VGAGSGAFSEMLLASGVQELVALEPSENLFPRLEVALDRHIHRGEAFVRNQTLGEFASEGSLAAPDTVVYLNVLEHILDDQSELRSVRSIISPGGHLLIFVPAHRWLMSEIDRQFGHHRRYSIAGLRETCRAAGFEVIGARYFDLPGIVTWWVRYRLFGSSTMEPAAVRFYDRVLVPFVRAVEDRCTPPIGKNIVMVGRAPGNPKCDG